MPEGTAERDFCEGSVRKRMRLNTCSVLVLWVHIHRRGGCRGWVYEGAVVVGCTKGIT